jgi:hypothetical protein
LNRYRVFIAQKNLQDLAAVRNKDGNVKGFVYTQDEQSQMVTNFIIYAKCLYNFNNNFNSKIIDIQTTMTKLPNCQVTTATDTSSVTSITATDSLNATSSSTAISTTFSTSDADLITPKRNLQSVAQQQDTKTLDSTTSTSTTNKPSYVSSNILGIKIN